jgi:hypothetical protein
MVDFERAHLSNSGGHLKANEQTVPEDATPTDDTPQHEGNPKGHPTGPDFQKRVRDAILPYVGHINGGLERTNALIGAADELIDEALAQDLLRAVVVLTHAYLEDALRTLARQLLPEAGEDVLKEIPLAGARGERQAPKFHLGKLIQHKGKTVDGVIQESIAQHLDRATYNDTSQITQQLETLGFKVSDHDQDFPAIQQMMQRRHQIVHRGDRVKGSDPNTFTLQPIDREQVLAWLSATIKFVHSLLQPLVFKVVMT